MDRVSQVQSFIQCTKVPELMAMEGNPYSVQTNSKKIHHKTSPPKV